MAEVAIAEAVSGSDDDREIARRIASGDRVALECMMRRYNRRLYRLARATQLRCPVQRVRRQMR